MKVRLPCEDIIAVPEHIESISGVKAFIDQETKIPSSIQQLYYEQRVLTDDLTYEAFSSTDIIDLKISIGGRYSIKRSGVDEGASECESFTPLKSILKNRDINLLSAPPKINVRAPGQKENGVLLAASYMKAFGKNRAARIGQLRRIRSQLDEGVVTLSMFNWGYNELFKNWVASCDLNKIDCRRNTLMFPTDEESDSLARKLGFRTYFDGQSYGEIPSTASESFGDGDFRRIIFAKIAMVQDMLEIEGDYLRQDIDLVWFADPREALRLKAEKDGLDMMFMADGPNAAHQPLHYNSGFVFLKNNPFTRYAWDQIFSNYGQILVAGGEQRMINLILACLKERGLRTAKLPENQYVNGHVFVKTGAVPKNSVVGHASWTSNIEAKKKIMSNLGLWYL